MNKWDKYIESDETLSNPNWYEKYAEQGPDQDEIYQQYKTSEKSSEELSEMPLEERYQYAQDLKTEREYLQSAGFTKGALSGATLGATEHVPGLKPQEHELNTGFGEILGSTLPITGIAKAVSLPMKYVMSGMSKTPKALSAVSKLMTSFGTGSVYETGKQLVKNEGLDPINIGLRGAEFAALDSLFRIGSKAVQWVSKLSPKQQASILEKGLIPDDLPKSQYETAAKIIEELKAGKPESRFAGEFEGTNSKINPKRITDPKDIGLRPTPREGKGQLQDEVGDIFSENKFYNTTEGGKAIKTEIMTLDEEVYRGVNELYNISKELNKGVEEIHPNLAGKIQSRIEELSKIPEPSDVQKRLIRASEKILETLAQVEEGQLGGYKPVSNQVLIDQIQSLRQIIDFDFSHGNTKNIFRPLINDLQESVLSASERSGNTEAVSAFNDARAGYKAWIEGFDNDYIRPFRDISNKDFSKLFNKSLDFDESNVIRSILNLSENGRELGNASVREIVEKNLSKFMENPRLVDPNEFNKVMRELESVITPDQSSKIKDQFREAKKRIDISAKHVPRKISKSEEVAAKYLDKKPEDIMGMMNNRSGIKELKENLSGSESKKKLFDTISKQKVRSIFREGNIEKDFTGNDLYEFLNKEKNYEILSEILGESETESLRLSAKEIGKSQVKKDLIKKKVKSAAAIKGLLFLTSII